MDIEGEALRAINPDTLLPGEAESGQLPEDAEHWISVYSELISTKLQLLANLKEMMARQSHEVQDELERADVRVIESQLERFRGRLEHWKQKVNG